MALASYNTYRIKVMDESKSTSGDDMPSNVVIEVMTTSGAYATLYADRRGDASLANPFLMDSTKKEAVFFSSATELRVGVYVYGDSSANNFANEAGGFGYLYSVTPTSRNKHVVIPRYGNIRLFKIPFLATGTNSDDTPNTWDNNEASAVIINGSSTTIKLPDGFIVMDAWVEVVVADDSATIDVGFLNSESSGDADGFIDGVSLTTAGIIRPTITERGALIASGTTAYERHQVNGDNQTISITGSSAVDTAKGNAWLMGYMMPVGSYT